MKFTPGQRVDLPMYAIPPYRLPLRCTVLGPCVCDDPHPDVRYAVADPWDAPIIHLREDALREVPAVP